MVTTSTCHRSLLIPNGKPVIISQAYRYNNTLGEVVLGLRAKAGGGYEVVSETGRYPDRGHRRYRGCPRSKTIA